MEDPKTVDIRPDSASGTVTNTFPLESDAVRNTGIDSEFAISPMADISIRGPSVPGLGRILIVDMG